MTSTTVLDIVDTIYAKLMRCGTNSPFSASDACTPDGGENLFFIGTVAGDRPSDAPSAPVFHAQAGGEPRVLHDGPAKLLALAPTGDRLAFAVANANGGDRLVVTALDGSVAVDLPSDGRVEQLAWSPNGQEIVLLVAGEGTDTTTLAGSIGGGGDSGVDPWAPTIDDGEADPEDWRRLVLYSIGSDALKPGPAIEGMIWEVSWCGNASVAILHSAKSGEAAWYRASLATLDLRTGALRQVYVPRRQLGHVQGSPDGDRIAFVEGVASDRGLVCGALKLVHAASGNVEELDTSPYEITSVAWRPDALHVAGQHGLTTVVGDIGLTDRRLEQIWSAVEWSCGAHLPASRPAGPGAAIAVVEGYAFAPRIALLQDGEARTVLMLSSEDRDAAAGHATPVEWQSPDGRSIEGILVQPAARSGPLPLVVDIHGGPIWAYRARWQGRQRAVPALIASDIAVLCPNPRGSFARGQDFAEAVLTDMGGADVDDILSGVDHLVAQGVADADRIGLTGSSYGGYMSAWLPKRRPQIAAAVCISPVSNWFSQHWTSNMPILEEIFIGGSPSGNPAGYLGRSPALSGETSTVATIILAGALDRCTPIGQAIELHRSLLDQGSTSVLVTYPCDGHSLRGPRSYIDSAARTLDWFVRHLTV